MNKKNQKPHYCVYINWIAQFFWDKRLTKKKYKQTKQKIYSKHKYTSPLFINMQKSFSEQNIIYPKMQT